jgi:hypothetical protein
MATTTLSPTQSVEGTFTPPYPPGWFDHFKAWVERLPMPYWVFYLLVATLFFALFTVIEWQVGALPFGTLNAFQAWLAFEIPLVAAIIHYLDRMSAHALAAMRPTLAVSDAEYTSLEYQLTHLPARSTLIFSLIGGAAGPVVVFLGLTTGGLGPFEQGSQVNLHPLSIGYVLLIFALTWLMYGVLFLHTIHQLRLISDIYDKHAQINLYNLGPLYAFSGITARTAIALVLMNVIWNLTAPFLSEVGISFATGLFFVTFGFSTFVVPLLGIHNRLVQQKERLLAENNHRIKATADDLYQQVDSRDFQRTTALKDSLTALDIHAKTLERIPTWPWEPGTARTVITAILFPIVVFLLQFVLQRFLK